jgi:RNase P/RNase MRP subunit p29
MSKVVSSREWTSVVELQVHSRKRSRGDVIQETPSVVVLVRQQILIWIVGKRIVVFRSAQNGEPTQRYHDRGMKYCRSALSTLRVS